MLEQLRLSTFLLIVKANTSKHVILVERKEMLNNKNHTEGNKTNCIMKNIKMKLVSNGNMIIKGIYLNQYRVFYVAQFYEEIICGNIHEHKNVKH